VVDQPLSDRTKIMLVWPIAGFFVVIAFGIGMISMAAFDSDNGSSDSAASSAAATSDAEVVDVELGDLFIEPAMIHAPAGTVTFQIENTGGTQHNFAIEGAGSTEMIDPGGSAELTVDLEAQTVGPYRFALEPFERQRLLEGLDDVALTLRHEEGIAEFEAARPGPRRRWDEG